MVTSSPASPPAAPLVGRVPETAVIEDLLARIGDRGGALLVRGEPGIGKSALLLEASRRASERGVHVLRTAGVQSEAHLPFAGLQRLLRPILSRVDALSVQQRD